MEDYSDWVIDEGDDYSNWQQTNAPLLDSIKRGFEEAPGFAGGGVKGIASGLSDIAEDNYSTSQFRKDLASGLLKGGRALAAAPGKAYNYLGELMYGDDFGNKISRAPDLPEYIRNFDYDAFTGGSLESPASQLVQGGAEFFPAMTLGGPILGTSAHATGTDENLIKELLGLGILHQGGKIAGKTPGLVKEIPNIGKNLTKAGPEWLTKERAGKSVGEPAKALSRELQGEYENIKNDLRSKGIKGDTHEQVTETITSNIIDPNTGKPVTQTITKMQAPSLEKMHKDLKGLTDKTIESVHKAFETRDIGDLIDAEKDIGFDTNNMWNDYWDKDIQLDRNALYRAEKMEKKIDGIISDMLKRGNPLEANRLINLRRRYHEELGQYLDIDPIRRYIKGDLTAADLTRRLQGNTVAAERFRATLANKYKAIGKNAFKNKLLKMGVKGTMLGELLTIAARG